MNKVEILRGKISKLVSLLAEKKLTVTQRGTTAFTKYDARSGKPTLVNIPQIPESASDEFISAIEGYLDHEVGHVLFTDFACIRKSNKDKLLAEIFNSVEDSFIERKMIERFAGSEYNINACGEYFTNLISETLETEGDPEKVVGLLFPSAIRAWSGRPTFQRWMESHWAEFTPVADKISDYCQAELPAIKSSEDSLRVSQKIFEMLSSPNEDEEGGGSDEENEEQQGDSESGDDGSGSSKKDKSDKESETSEESDSDKESEEDSESSPESKPAKSEKDAEASEEAEEGKETAEKKDPKTDVFADVLKKAFTKEAKGADKENDYRVYTTEFDKIETIEVSPERSDRYANAMDDVSSMLGVVQKKLERAIAAQSLSVWSGGYRSGKLNSTALTRYITSGDDRVFKRKHIAETKDTAVTLLVDCSGSMAGTEIRIASQTAYALSTVLDRMNIKNEVLGFTTQTGSINNRVKIKSTEYDFACSRQEPLLTYIYKGFNERVTNVHKLRFGKSACSDIHMRNNADGESLMIAASRLAARPEKRKILIVLSDGMPVARGAVNFSKHLTKTIARINKETNINLVGIGIRNTSVRRFYKDHVVIDNIDELPTTVMDSVRRILLTR